MQDPIIDMPVVIRKRQFNTVEELCKFYNVTQEYLQEQLASGKILEDALPARYGKYIVVDGNEFPSVRAAVKHYGLNYATISNRLQSPYWTIEEAFELVPHESVVTHTGSAKPITINGKTYASIDEACEEYKLPRALVYTRRKRGWSIEEAFGIKERNTSKYGYKNYGNKNAKSVTIDGVTYGSIKEASEHYGIKCQTLYWRLRHGTPINEALTQPVQETRESKNNK